MIRWKLRIKNWTIPQLSKSDLGGSDLLLLLPSVIGLGFILALGPFFQTYISTLLTSSEIGIYSSIHGDDLAGKLTIEHLIDFTAHGHFVWLSLLFFLFSRRINSARALFFYSSVFFATGLTATDAVISAVAIYIGNQTLFWESVLFNIIGAPIIAGYLVLQARIIHLCRKQALSKSVDKVLAAILPIAISALITVFFGFIASSLLYPSATKILLEASPTLRASYLAGDQKHNHAFRVLPVDSGGTVDQIFGESIINPVSIHWKQTSEGFHHTLYYRMFSDCSAHPKMNRLPTNSWVPVSKVTQFRIETDAGGPTDLLINKEDDIGFAQARISGPFQVRFGSEGQAKRPKFMTLVPICATGPTSTTGEPGAMSAFLFPIC